MHSRARWKNKIRPEFDATDVNEEGGEEEDGSGLEAECPERTSGRFQLVSELLEINLVCLHQRRKAAKPDRCSTDTRSFPVATSKEETTLSTPSVFNRALVVLLQTAEGKRCRSATSGTVTHCGCQRALWHCGSLR